MCVSATANTNTNTAVTLLAPTLCCYATPCKWSANRSHLHFKCYLNCNWTLIKTRSLRDRAEVSLESTIFPNKLIPLSRVSNEALEFQCRIDVYWLHCGVSFVESVGF